MAGSLTKTKKKRNFIKLLLAIFTLLIVISLMYIFLILPSLRDDIRQEKMAQTREMVDVGLSVLQRYHNMEERGIMSREDAQEEAGQMIRSMHYGDQELDYFWINDFNHEVIVHPFRPDLEGMNVYEYEDPEGFLLFQEFVDISKEKGEGHVSYSWQYYEESDRVEEKLSYVAAFEPWEWIIGTGVYLTEFETIIAERRNIALALIAMFFLVASALIAYYYKGKIIEHELLESEEKYRLIADNTADVISILDLDFRYLYVSPAVFNIKGFTPEEAVLRNLEETMTPDSLKKFFRLFDRQMALEEKGDPETVRKFQLETEEYTKDGSTIWMDSTVTILRDESNKPIGIMAVCKDITNLKEAEKELKHLNEELEKRVDERTAELEWMNKELSAFTYSVSHDLRAPLRSIQGFSEAVLEDHGAGLTEEGIDYLKRVVSASYQMSELIDDLLKLSRVTRQELYYDQVDLSSMVEAHVQYLKENDPQRKVEVLITTSLYVNGDAALLRIALNNLLSNAWKFTSAVDPARIKFGAMQNNGCKIYFIADNGIGFENKKADKIFNAFQRLHSFQEYPGTGIGLSIVQRIIERHNGRIWCEGEPGNGATFYFTLQG